MAKQLGSHDRLDCYSHKDNVAQVVFFWLGNWSVWSRWNNGARPDSLLFCVFFLFFCSSLSFSLLRKVHADDEHSAAYRLRRHPLRLATLWLLPLCCLHFLWTERHGKSTTHHPTPIPWRIFAGTMPWRCHSAILCHCRCLMNHSHVRRKGGAISLRGALASPLSA